MRKQTKLEEFNQTIEDAKKCFRKMFKRHQMLLMKNEGNNNSNTSKFSYNTENLKCAELTLMFFDSWWDSSILNYSYFNFFIFEFTFCDGQKKFYGENNKQFLSKFKDIRKILPDIMTITYSFKEKIWTFEFTDCNRFQKRVVSDNSKWLLEECVSSIISQESYPHSFGDIFGDSTATIYDRLVKVKD